MTVACPNGHESETADYCDQCGSPIVAAASASAPQATAILPSIDEADTSPATRKEPCPACGAERSGDDRYCEGCGHDFLAPPRARASWEVVVSADRAQFDRLAPAGLSFPEDYPERRFTLREAEVRIGRSHGRTGEPTPDIDLAGAPEDPGISRVHAVLVRQESGGYAVRDLGSTNGTSVNDDLDRVGTDAAVPLADGDRIRLGAWTAITLRAR